MSESRISPVKIDNYKPLREIVFESLREAIVKQVIRPGERLMEIQLAEELGVSRTPIREAIRKLEQEGFVIIIPRKGAYVAEISFKDIHELFEIRAALEGLASSLAAERATEEELEEMEKLLFNQTEHINSGNISESVKVDVTLHDLIYKASRNERLLNTLYNLRKQVHRFRIVSISTPGRKAKTIEEHKWIVEAISERNVELAKKLSIKHMEHAEQATIHYLKDKLGQLAREDEEI